MIIPETYIAAGAITLPPEKLAAIRRAIDYFHAVIEKQERILSFSEIYQGYKATIHELTENSMQIVYLSWLEALKEVCPEIFGKEK